MHLYVSLELKITTSLGSLLKLKHLLPNEMKLSVEITLNVIISFVIELITLEDFYSRDFIINMLSTVSRKIVMNGGKPLRNYVVTLMGLSLVCAV
jgi:hypothetical protein